MMKRDKPGWRTVCGAVLVYLAASAPSALADSQEGDLESLLRSVDEALEPAAKASDPPDKKVTPAPRSSVGKPKRRAAVRPKPSPRAPRAPDAPGVRRSGEATPSVSEPTPAPSHSPELKAFLQFSELSSESDPLLSGSSFGIGAGVATLRGGLSVTKNDDVFALNTSQSLVGVGLQFSPSWHLLDIGGSPVARLFLVTSIYGGVFGGDFEMVRTGVFNETRKYAYFYFPAFLEAGLRVQLNRVEMDLTYGAGVGVLSQRGDGQTDTVTSLIPGDAVSLTLSWRAFRTLGFYAQYQMGGFDLIERSSGYAADAWFVGVRTFASEAL